jgi:peptidoglycan/LPS O-acetylase OafA/YrhL
MGGREAVTRTGGGSRGASAEALRVLAALVVIAGHSAMAYAGFRLTNTLWPVTDPAGSPWLLGLCCAANAAAMPLFFFLAGQAAARGLAARGTAGFLLLRARRLVFLFALALVTVVPLTYLAWGYGLLRTGECTLVEVFRLRFRPELEAELVGPLHLWFLEYLLILSAGYAGLRALAGRSGADGAFARLGAALGRLPRFVVLAVPALAVLAWDGEAFVRSRNSFVPDVPRVLYYASFFFAGAGRWGESRPPTRRRSCLELLLALPPLGLVWAIALGHLARGGDGMPWAARVAAALSSALLVSGLVGLVEAKPPRIGRAVSWLARASYWTYLLHVPVVIICQAVLWGLDWPAEAKFLAVVAVGLGLPLGVYALVGRHRRPARSRAVAEVRPRSAAVLAGARLAGGAAFAALLAAAVWLGRPVLWENNFHTVIAGEVYRSARLGPEGLEAAIARHGLRAVLCLSGDKPQEVAAARAVCEGRGVAFFLVHQEVGRIPTVPELRRLTEVLRTAPRPLLITGRWGLGPTGLASAAAVLLAGEDLEAALGQFGACYGQLDRPCQEEVLGSYRAWLTARGAVHEPSRFAGWVEDLYTFRHYRADVAPLELPGVCEAGAAVPCRFRVTNHSPEPWHVRGETGQEIQLAAVLVPAGAGRPVLCEARCRLGEGVVRPGESREAAVTLPAPPRPGRYILFVDLVEGHVTWFSTQGSRPFHAVVEVAAGAARAGPPARAGGQGSDVHRHDVPEQPGEELGGHFKVRLAR